MEEWTKETDENFMKREGESYEEKKQGKKRGEERRLKR